MIRHLTYIFFLFFLNAHSQDDSKSLILSGVDAMYEKNHELSIELLTRAKSVAENNGVNEDIFLALNNIGANYYSMLDYGEALDYYLEAYKVAIDSLDSSYEMSVLNNIAILYSKDKSFKKAEEYFMNAYTLAKKNKDHLKQSLYAINLGHVFNEQNQLNLAKDFLQEAINLSVDSPRLHKDAKVTLIKNTLLNGDFNKAKTNALKLLPELKSKESSENKVILLLIISKAFQVENNFDEALNYVQKSLNEDVSSESKIEIFEQLSSLYIENKMFSNALAIKDSLIELSNKIEKTKKNRLYEANRVKFEIQNYQNEIKNNIEKIGTQQKQYNLLLFFSVLVILLIVWVLLKSFQTNKQKRALFKRDKEIMKLELDKEKTEHILLEKQLKEQKIKSLLKQETLKNEIESKNRKLSAKALYLSDRNSIVSSIINDLENLNLISNNPQLIIHTRKLNKLIKSDDEWDEFINHFEEVNQGFLNKLKSNYPDLNLNDIRFISYLYMNLSMKEIASIFNITSEACRKRKERISKKLGLEASTLLYDYLYTI